MSNDTRRCIVDDDALCTAVGDDDDDDNNIIEPGRGRCLRRFDGRVE